VTCCARTRVASLMRFLLVKRLESSVDAFRSTLRALISSNRNFRASLEQGFVPVGTTATSFLAGDAFQAEELLVRLHNEERRRMELGTARGRMLHPASDFDLDVSAHQRGIALLQQFEQHDPDLWRTLLTLPDGLRSSTAVPAPNVDAGFSAHVQHAMFLPVQTPLGAVEQVPPETPVDAPGTGDTVVLLEQGGISLAYAVGTSLHARRITPTQLINAVACTPETPLQPLPVDTNERVMAAFDQARSDIGLRLASEGKPTSNPGYKQYLKKQFPRLRDQFRDDDSELQRISVLQRIFSQDIARRPAEAVQEIARLKITGEHLLQRLEALRTTYQLNLPEDTPGARIEDVGVLRIVCSDGLV